MSEEELKEVKEIIKRLYAGTGVTIGDILDTSSWLDKLVNEVEKLQKEKKQSQEILSSIKIAYMVHTKDCELLLKDIKKWEKILDK